MPGKSWGNSTLAYVKAVNIISGVARAFPGGRVAHPEGQNEDEN